MALARTGTLTFSATQVTLTNTTGDYNAVTNPGGYGAPNPTFASLHHYGILRKKAVGTETDEVLSVTSDGYASALTFVATRERDGWFEGKLLDISIWDSGTAYTGGTLVTGSVVSYLGVVYYSILNGTNQQPNISPTYWTAVTDYTTIEDNASISVTTVGRVTVYDADLYWSNKMALNSQNGRVGLSPDDRQTAALNRILWHIQCALVADQFGNNSDGEWNVRTLRSLGAKAAE